MPAGQKLSAGRIPGERIATAVLTGDFGAVTTVETSLGSVTAALVSGRTYRVRFVTRIGSTVANDTVLVRIREDTVAGNELIGDFYFLPSTGAAGNIIQAEGEYTASATAAKTFHLTVARNAGTGTYRREGTFMPTYIYVEYVRG